MFDREDFNKVAKKRIESRKPLLHQLIASAPAMELMTRSYEWNRYLSYLQARIEQTVKIQQSALTILTDSNVTESEVLMKAKILYASSKAREEAFQEAISLPQQVMESGKSAEELLAKLDTA